MHCALVALTPQPPSRSAAHGSSPSVRLFRSVFPSVYLIRLALPVASIGITCFRAPEEVLAVLRGRKPRKACHSVLDLWNRCLLLAVVPVNSPIRRAYTVSPVQAVWPACSSRIVSKDPGSSFSELPSSSFPRNADRVFRYFWLTAMATWRYVWILSLHPRPASVSC